jgi:hypothetical protein
MDAIYGQFMRCVMNCLMLDCRGLSAPQDKYFCRQRHCAVIGSGMQLMPIDLGWSSLTPTMLSD